MIESQEKREADSQPPGSAFDHPLLALLMLPISR